MYMVFIIDDMHHLMNESKIVTFTYNIDRKMSLLLLFYLCTHLLFYLLMSHLLINSTIFFLRDFNSTISVP